MADTFVISKKDGSKVVEGASPLTITGLTANTQYNKGDFVAQRKVGEALSAKVDLPAFKTKLATVAVTGVTLAPATANIAVGATQQLTPTVTPTNATNKQVTYTSDKEAVATVNASGLVTGVTAGTANITVTTADGAKTAKSLITVTAEA